jgi:hypothetical protein
MVLPTTVRIPGYPFFICDPLLAGSLTVVSPKSAHTVKFNLRMFMLFRFILSRGNMTHQVEADRRATGELSIRYEGVVTLDLAAHKKVSRAAAKAYICSRKESSCTT